jgi:hypothetical protein
MLPISCPFVPPVLLPDTSHSPNNTQVLLISECLLYTDEIKYKLYCTFITQKYIGHNRLILQ